MIFIRIYLIPESLNILKPKPIQNGHILTDSFLVEIGMIEFKVLAVSPSIILVENIV